MERGWLKLWRKLVDSPHWYNGQFDPGKAWVDLLLRAAYEPKRVRDVTVPAGACLVSVTLLAEAWGWGRGRVTRFLQDLAERGDITWDKGDTSRKWSLVHVVRWPQYQGAEAEQFRNSSAEQSQGVAHGRGACGEPTVYVDTSAGPEAPGGTVPEDLREHIQESKKRDSTSSPPEGSPPPPDGNGHERKTVPITVAVHHFVRGCPHLGSKVKDPEALAGIILADYLEQGEAWLTEELRECWRWCRANAKKAGAKKDAKRFILNWLRRAARAKETGRPVFERKNEDAPNQGPRWRDPKRVSRGFGNRGLKSGGGEHGGDGERPRAGA